MDYDNRQLEERSEMLKVLAHPIRLCVVKYLIENGTKNVSQLQSILEIPQPTVSSHLGKLKRARVLTSRREGTEIYYGVESKLVQDLIVAIFEKI
ncbi:MAG: metalloregulator ArsR/SmtB family transcription factor [Peptoniphilus sp.]|uniref:Transcriptional repressor PagR n=2 Tax=Peptoniphilus indolicus TaxID=33030 RepID=G4D431_9FIRM|nr:MULTISPECIES: metalloregulator ArsR/SmtB family transcription factor [Peptoniphilus]EGY79716.1 transcriptional repressor PagR [Peptoniphilus indolicus ATCC 29427]MDY2986494.1 metalloregulator ArsR/SmtB family transcription factor [Peptoniphilus sp.]SUB75854.1 Protective antigen repressor [Peptoniphilus indolicus]